MLHRLLTTFLGCLLTVHGRDPGRTFKSIPTITGSLVNLGKMDISFHFNSKELLPAVTAPHSLYFPKPEPMIDEPCPCSSMRGVKDHVSQPGEMLNRILNSNDLFSFNKEPLSSTLCCGSHEHAQEEIVTFEFNPKDGPLSSSPFNNPSIPRLPFIFDNFLPKRPAMTPIIPGKPKAVEIFLFPKKKDAFVFPPPPKKNFVSKDNIQIVGDKVLKNDFKSLKFRPSLPINFQSNSVKKDLTAQEKNETVKQTEKDEIQVTTATNSNSLK